MHASKVYCVSGGTENYDASLLHHITNSESVSNAKVHYFKDVQCKTCYFDHFFPKYIDI